ncbi:hypothetical protein [Streptomyces sp. RKAG293]|uniref:hypothetical protein n=1 Tax=Streptomyces sp. RKAG293 TaxID=2893403 RepID=UPI002033FC15|nr:hypothetical protein [Streptomyces sp. RKAG293]MCM2422885.1 hypothetical protein [Streptomyces sp. RKAG293]
MPSAMRAVVAEGPPAASADGLDEMTIAGVAERAGVYADELGDMAIAYLLTPDRRRSTHA